MVDSLVNRNLTVANVDSFYGLPVMVDKGPFILEYLERLRWVINSALADYSRVLAFRVDLRIPTRLGLADDFNTNKVISRFFESFKAKIESDRHRARVAATYAHDTKVRYFWVREVSTGNVQHYHVLILLNMDAYYTVGRLGSDRVNMVRRLDEAWASALGLKLHDVSGLVEFPANATWRLKRNADDFAKTLSSLFHRASYLCKSATKHYGQQHHGMGGSRK